MSLYLNECRCSIPIDRRHPSSSPTLLDSGILLSFLPVSCSRSRVGQTHPMDEKPMSPPATLGVSARPVNGRSAARGDWDADGVVRKCPPQVLLDLGKRRLAELDGVHDLRG